MVNYHYKEVELEELSFTDRQHLYNQVPWVNRVGRRFLVKGLGRLAGTYCPPS